MILLVRPVLFAFLQSSAVKKLVLDLCKKLAESTDNQIDDQLCNALERAMFPEQN